MRMRVSLLLLLLLSPALDAAEMVIKEAFGISLGEPLDVTALELQALDEKDRKGGEAYVFVPQHPYEPLNEYTVVVTPLTKTVYSIQAVGTFKNRTACKAEMGQLEQLLARKYGRRNADPAAKFTGSSRIVFGSGPRKITVSCSGIFTHYKLKLIYQDKSIDLTEKKGVVQESGSRDSSGL
ncbi:MAG: hypothetical protein ACE5ET_03915 [Gammaproteobacteria bacterium]